MSKKLLVDASHSEEIRVAVVADKKLEEFDSETTNKKLFKGNIYLAKVMRVEPSLQAAFVEYGSGRQGFLPFSEIHPDYYQIPVSDRDNNASEITDGEDLVIKNEGEELDSEPLTEEAYMAEAIDLPEIEKESIELIEDASDIQKPKVRRRKNNTEKDNTAEHAEKKHHINYKIQEVIKRRQILLVQVMKEERGNKGAALTTYLSLAGRYCVLMPNAGRRNGGISKKIGDVTDRSRLRKIIDSLDVPEGMSLIVRTAGQERRKTEIKRDYDYLTGLWGKIRELTIRSIAPALIYEEADLVKRVLRDMYDNDIEEILIEGDNAYKRAKTLMKQMIPSHTKKVQNYKDENIPLFHAYNVEKQLDDVINPVCTLPSGGSIVIHITEALVAVDINSGKSTKERNIDSTALNTNLEAADEIARQLRLRDLAGLIVIDFIDMYENKHIQQVERRLKEALKSDRARIQLGRISQFGLMELSRQRLRPSLVESYSSHCQHCHGSGFVRSTESTALQIIRTVEGEAIKGNVKEIYVQAPKTVDLYLLNQKRDKIVQIEKRFGIKILVEQDKSLLAPLFNIDVIKKNISSEITKDDEPVALQKKSLPDFEPTQKNNQTQNKHQHQHQHQHQKVKNTHEKKNTTTDNQKNINNKQINSKEEEKVDQSNVEKTEVKDKPDQKRKRHHPYHNRKFKKNFKGKENSSSQQNPAKDEGGKIVNIESKIKEQTPRDEQNTEGNNKAKKEKRKKSWLRRLLET